MKVVKRTDNYTIYQRRDKRYAIEDKKRNPIRGDDKVKILVEEKLLEQKLPEPPAPAEEAAAEPAAEAPTEEAAGEEAAQEESQEEKPAE